jgi:hypothetical protein
MIQSVLAVTKLTRTVPLAAIAALMPGLAGAVGDYCVRPVPVLAAAGTPSNLLPQSFASIDGAEYPVVLGDYAAETPEGDRRRSLWSFADDGSLVGPHDSGLSVDNSRAAASPAGLMLTVGGRHVREEPGIELHGSDRKWQTRLMEAVAGMPTLAPPELQQTVEWPRHVFWSDLLDGFLISSMKGEHGTTQRTWLLHGDATKPLVEYTAELVADLPGFGATAVLGSRRLSFVYPDGRTAEVAHLNSGDDYNGWDGLHETSDPGWLYVDGAQYDHAIFVDAHGPNPILTKSIRFWEDWKNRDVGFFDRALRAFLDMPMPDEFPGRAHVGPCRSFSRAIGRMIFCDDHYELRDGAVVPIGGGSVPLARHLGDAGRLGITLFIGADGRLYAYDGETLRPIRGEALEHGLVQDLPAIGRTFISTNGALFELRGPSDDLELVRLPFSGAGFPTVRLAPGAGDALVFTQSGIDLIEADSLRPLWQPPAHARLLHHSSADVRGWNGTLLAVARGTSGAKDIHLLTTCPESNGNQD